MTAAAPRTMTIEEFSEFEGDSPCDLIDGELVEMAAGGLHGMVALTIGSALLSFVRPRHLGAVMVLKRRSFFRYRDRMLCARTWRIFAANGFRRCRSLATKFPMRRTSRLK